MAVVTRSFVDRNYPGENLLGRIYVPFIREPTRRVKETGIRMALVLLAVAVAAILVPARRSAGLDPVKTLGEE